MPCAPRLFGRCLVLLFALCLVTGAFAQVTETVLPNGLKVLIKEVHAAPVVTVDTWYKVGSRNEIVGLTGGSHLLEHMTYKGSTSFPKEAMRDLIKRNGAVDNGATFYDYTHYYTTIASDRLELPLRLEASRMHEALIRQQDLDSEMSVVRSELEGRENSPNSLLFTALMAAAFRESSYRWPVIGWRADVEHMTADQLRRYYRTYYVPNNATLVIVGDVDTAKTLALVKKHYGGIKRGPQPSQWTTPEQEQRGERRVTVHRRGQVPVEYIAWHVPGVNHADIPALMLLDQVIGTGRLSRIYQKVVEAKLGVSGWSSTLLLRDAGLFLVGGAVAPGQKLLPVEAALFTEVERIKKEQPTTEEMARALRQMEASLIYDRDSVTQQAQQFGYYETVTGDWRYLEKLPAKLRAVTPADISRVATAYLTEDNRTVAIFQPANGKGAATSAAPMVAPAGYREANVPARLGGMTAVPTAARPSAPPSAQPKAAVKRERFELPNGVVLIVQENHANATVSVRSSLKAGKAYDPAGKAGVADMVANLLDRGTTTRSSSDIAREMEGAAAEISSGTGWETVGVNGRALSGDVELLIRNMADLVRNANFPPDEIEKMREQMQTDLAMERDQPSANARRAFYRAALPEGNPYRLTSFDEDEAGLKAITRDDLLAFHRARYTPRTLMMAVVGDVKVDDVRKLVEKYFGDWQGDTPALIPSTRAEAGKAERIVTNIPDKSEVSIYAGYAGGLRRTDPDYYAAQVMNRILGGGGALQSRLGDVIRDKNGLAYSVYSTFHASTGAGPWFAMLGVNPANTDKAVSLLQAEIVRMRDQGVSAQEVKDATAFITGSYAIALETNAAMAAELMDAEYFHLGLDYPERAAALYGAVTRDQVNAAAKKFMHPDQLVISIAGAYGKSDSEKVKE
ncbi:MAG: M16 family metallopeptidase [Armatimonadota bacterium]